MVATQICVTTSDVATKCIMTNVAGVLAEATWKNTKLKLCEQEDKRLKFIVFMLSVRCCSQAKNLLFVPIVDP